jgi:hypothetical protein
MLRSAHQSPDNLANGCRTVLVECFLMLMNANFELNVHPNDLEAYATIGQLIWQLSDVPTCMQSLSRMPRVLFMLFRMHGSLQLAS